MTITTSRRIGALALLATIAFGACSNGAASTAPARPPARPRARRERRERAPSTGASHRRPPDGPDRHRHDQRLGLVHRRTHLDGRRRAVKASNPGFNFTVTGPGTGDGFKTFCKGETDISDASRKIKDEEAATCAAAGIEYVELKIAYDGMTVMTSPDNAAVTCLSFADLYALTGPQSQGFDKWSSATDPRQVARLEHGLPGRRPVDHRPRRGVRHV